LDGEQAVLQLLSAQLRATVAAADGDRAADRVAAGVTARARADVPVAALGCRRGRRVAARARRGLVSNRPDRVHVLGLRAGVDRAGVRAWDACPEGARDGEL